MIRDAILHVLWKDPSLALRIAWGISILATAAVTRWIVRRQQSRAHVLELKTELRHERRQHERDCAELQARVDKMLPFILVSSTAEARNEIVGAG